MRWLCLFLLVLNLLCLFLWNRQAAMAVNTEPVRHLQDDEGQPIRLLRELDLAQLKPRKTGTSSTTAASDSCQFLGSLEYEDQAHALRQRLARLDIRTKIQAVDFAGVVDYWLYLSPLISKEAALRQIDALRAQGIESHLIPQGELKNGISLGLFSRAEHAERLRQRLQGIGYLPQWLELPRTQRRYWLRLLSDKASIDAGMLRTLAVDFGRLEQRTAACALFAGESS